MGTGDSGNQVSDMALALIEEQAEQSIRRVWHDDRWYFSVIDVIGLLTDSTYPNRYWSDLKRKLAAEGATQPYDFLVRLKMTAPDGKQRVTDAADTETVLRIIQSVPSPKAEPVKQWLAHVGAKRLDEVVRPLDTTQVSREIRSVPKPAMDAPALEWAEYHEQLAVLYRRQAAYEARLATIEARQDRLEDRMESVEEVSRLLPEFLERLGPQTLSPEHQVTVKAMAVRLHDVSGLAFATIYADLNAAFHVARYADIPDASWPQVVAWLQARIAARQRR